MDKSIDLGWHANLSKFCRLTNLPLLQMSEAADQAVVEGTLADMLYHLDNEGKLPEFV